MATGATILTYLIFFILIFFFQWKEADDGQIMDSKLKCMFKMPDSGDSAGVTAAVANGAEKTSNEIPSSVPTKPSSPKVKPNFLKNHYISLKFRCSEKVTKIWSICHFFFDIMYLVASNNKWKMGGLLKISKL